MAQSTASSPTLLGAHVSAAGGLDKVFSRGRALGCESLQLFTRAPSQWSATPLSEAVIESFRAARAEFGGPVFAHDIYLTNLAAANEEVRLKSLQSLREELQRCSRLAIDGLVCHLGSHPDEALGLERLALGLGEVLQATDDLETPILMETTAGQGNCLGHRFEHLRECLRANQWHPRLQVCLDSCHVTAAGYDLSTPEGVVATLASFDELIGLERLRLLHLNDSKKPLGSRVDRHDHIGQGAIGEAGFAALVSHPRIVQVPGIIETPEMESMHAVNLALLKQLRRGERS